MKNGFLILLLLLVGQESLAAEDELEAELANIQRCYMHVPPADNSESTALNEQPIVITADKARAKQDDSASFSGGVTVDQGIRHLGAESVEVDSRDSTLKARGDINYKDSMISVEADSLSSELNTYDTQLNNAEYQLHGFNGRGVAETLKVKNKTDVVLTQTTYTACPPGDISWQVSAEKINIDSSGEWAEAHGAVIEIYEVPVFYLPYFTYPISNKRKSGFLFPDVGTSTDNGLDIKAPYYLNISPDYDATITPRVMSRRGVQVQTEFRYLGDNTTGIANAEYLPDDQKMGDDRWMLHWKHEASYARHWRLNTDVTKVGDVNYFNELGSNIQSSTDNQLLQSGQMQYLDSYWEVSMELRDFQVLGGGVEDPYTMLPQLSYKVDYPLGISDLRFTLNSEYTQFENSGEAATTAQRLHVEPGLILPWVWPQGFITSEAKLIQTNYAQDVSEVDKGIYSDSVNRTLPEFRIHGGLNFERSTSIFGEQYTQTLEPQLQYLYIPYKEQNDIGIYDTASLQSDYYGLFRDQRYSGLDRIADANQVTFGLTSRYLNNNAQERFRFSIGQNYYLEQSKVVLDAEESSNELKRSSLVMEFDTNFAGSWSFNTSSELDTHEGVINKTNTAIEYRPEAGKLIQLNHRYLNTDLETPDINQIGSKLSWPLDPNYLLVASYYRDLIQDRSIENYIGVQYDSCCWAVRVIYERYIKTNYESDLYTDASAKFDSGVKLQFELKGFGSVDSIKDSKMLDGSRFKYGQPFYLDD